MELVDRQDGPSLTRVLIGKVDHTPVEVLVDGDDRIKRGKCLCGHFKKFGLRNGPCRHMIALRRGASAHGLKAYELGGLVNQASPAGRDEQPDHETFEKEDRTHRRRAA